MYNVGDQIDEIVKIGNVKLVKSKYYISETEIIFNTESGCILIWKLPFPKDETTLRNNTEKNKYFKNMKLLIKILML
ncbi:hypothetical protein EfmJHP10_34490 (plasmid) [Enterococcus faecium]|nr:hypothetical protein EfmJHP10_34490 [Enterococcus faecium]